MLPDPISNALVEVVPIAITRQKRRRRIHNSTSAQSRATRIENTKSRRILMSIDSRITTYPVLTTRQSPHHQIVALRALFIISVAHKEMPRHALVAEAV